jgi:AraC family transcriptional regulator, transcriptional activator of pobA
LQIAQPADSDQNAKLKARCGLKSISNKIPSFSLYGEQAVSVAHTDSLHIEDIQSRSRKYLWRIGTHRHTVLCQCVLVTAGAATAVLEESQSSFNGPAVMIIPAGTIHSFRFRPDTQGYVLTVNLQRLLSVASGALQAPIEALFAVPRAIDLGLNPSLAARASQQLECLLHEFRQPEMGMEPIRSCLACCALWTVALGSSATMAGETHSGPDLERLRQFRVLMESHYAHHWPVERYARQLGLSETSLNRLCRRLTGSTGFDLVQQRLALEARRRLMYLPSSVHGIASELGFKDSAYFCRFFRRHSGLSPQGFRRRHAGG